MNYVFYDTETTGTETHFDQILQFAAVKTDADLRELERFNIRCRVSPYVVASPGALRANRISVSMLTDPNFPTHFEAICAIREKMLAWSPAVFFGYNSIDFDEDLLRQAFFKSLLPLYLTNTNSNCRSDVLRMARATSVYARNSIVIPLNDGNKPTFKLDVLAPANGFAHENAHEAVADVLATIHVARLIKERASDVWQAMLHTAVKQNAISLVKEKAAISLTEFYRGKEYSWLVTYCGENPENAGQVAVFDLQNEPTKYFGLSVDRLVKVLNASPKVIRSVRMNAQPILMPQSMVPESVASSLPNQSEIERRVDAIRGNAEFMSRVGQALAKRYEDQEPSPHVEARIYEGFPGAEGDDETLLQQFHTVPWEQRFEVVARFSDQRLKELGLRLLYAERPDVLPAADRAVMEGWMRDRILTEDPNVPWLTVPKAIIELNDLKVAAGDTEVAAFNEIQAYLDALIARYAPP